MDHMEIDERGYRWAMTLKVFSDRANCPGNGSSHRGIKYLQAVHPVRRAPPRPIGTRSRPLFYPAGSTTPSMCMPSDQWPVTKEVGNKPHARPRPTSQSFVCISIDPPPAHSAGACRSPWCTGSTERSSSFKLIIHSINDIIKTFSLVNKNDLRPLHHGKNGRW